MDSASQQHLAHGQCTSKHCRRKAWAQTASCQQLRNRLLPFVRPSIATVCGPARGTDHGVTTLGIFSTISRRMNFLVSLAWQIASSLSCECL